MLEQYKVLVVDDQASIRKILKGLLSKRLGCKNIIEADDGDTAWEYLQANDDVSFVISDWEMKRMSGDELLYNIRNSEQYRTLPFLMVTSRNDKDTIITAIQAGVNEFVTKPYAAELMIEKIRRVLLSSGRRQHDRYTPIMENFVRVVPEGAQTGMEGKLVNLSEGGVLVRLNFNRNLGVYDDAEVTIKMKFESAPEETCNKILAKCIRVEWDGMTHLKKTARYAFIFTTVAPKNREALARITKKMEDDVPDMIGGE